MPKFLFIDCVLITANRNEFFQIAT
jgi:hypothetical protein